MALWARCIAIFSMLIHFNGDVVDMEAFAQAMVCKEMNVDFVSVKYITDIIGQNSGQIWLDKLRDAREALKEFFA